MQVKKLYRNLYISDNPWAFCGCLRTQDRNMERGHKNKGTDLGLP